MTVMELRIAPGRPRRAEHIHLREDELWWVLEGDFRFRTADDWLRASTGGMAFGPEGCRTPSRTIGDTPGRLLIVTTPVGRRAVLRAVRRQGTLPVVFDQLTGHRCGELARLHGTAAQRDRPAVARTVPGSPVRAGARRRATALASGRAGPALRLLPRDRLPRRAGQRDRQRRHRRHRRRGPADRLRAGLPDVAALHRRQLRAHRRSWRGHGVDRVRQPAADVRARPPPRSRPSSSCSARSAATCGRWPCSASSASRRRRCSAASPC